MSGIPIESVDHIELILGPGSVLYGTNALYGTINIVTRSAGDIDGFRVFAEASLSPNQRRSGALASPDLERFGHQYRLGLEFGKKFTLLSTPASLTVYANLLDDRQPAYKIGPQYNYDSTTDTRGPINVGPNAPAGRSDVWSGYQADMHVFVPNLYAKFGWGNFDSTFRVSRVSHDQNQTGPWGELNQKDGGGADTFVHGDATYRLDLNERFSLRPRVYASYYDYRDTNRAHTPWVCDVTEPPCIQSVGFTQSLIGAGVNGNIDWFANGRMNTLLGVDARIIDISATTETYPAAGGVKIPSGNYGVHPDPGLAVFGQHIAKITDEIRLNLGVRADWFKDVSHVSPRAALIVDPWKGGTIKAIYSDGFRRPAAYESYYVAPGAQAMAMNLHPETMQTIEGALEQRIGRHSAKLSLFRTWLSGLVGVGTDPVSALSQYQNTGKMDAYGANLAYETSYEGWRFGLHATISSSKRPSQEADVSAAAWQLYGRNQPVLGAPNISGNAQTSYAFGGDYPTLALAAHLIGPRVAPAPLDDPELSSLVTSGAIGKVPLLVQIRGTVTGKISFVDGMSYRFAADVVTPTYNFYTVGPLGSYRDSQGRLRPDYQQLPRLTLILGVEYRL
jgi:outer membrane receptor protein involved in Fe transport